MDPVGIKQPVLHGTYPAVFFLPWHEHGRFIESRGPTKLFGSLRNGGKLAVEMGRICWVFVVTNPYGSKYILTSISGFIPSYNQLQPWLNRVCWGWGPFL